MVTFQFNQVAHRKNHMIFRRCADSDLLARRIPG